MAPFNSLNGKITLSIVPDRTKKKKKKNKESKKQNKTKKSYFLFFCVRMLSGFMLSTCVIRTNDAALLQHFIFFGGGGGWGWGWGSYYQSFARALIVNLSHFAATTRRTTRATELCFFFFARIRAS